MHMDVKITAKVNGGEDEDGMRLAELEDTLTAIRMAGGQDSTRLKVDTSRKSRVRAVTGQIRDDDEATRDLDVVDEAPGAPQTREDGPA